jgi:cyclic dehypoxanthinyl futalosine synthase
VVTASDRAEPLRIHGVHYLNARPLWQAFADGAVKMSREHRLVLAAPAEVARAIAEGDADVALLPVAAAAALGGLELVPGSAIGADGPVRSVAIFGERPLEHLDTIALDLSSRTSVVLARLLLAARGLRPRLLGASAEDALAQVGGATGALAIGDSALAVEGRFAYTLDLAAAWKELTGLPFVFAAWFARPGALAAGDREAFGAAKAYGIARAAELASEHAEAHGLDAASLTSYLRESLRYDLDEPALRGLGAFFTRAAEAGHLPRSASSALPEAAPRLERKAESLDRLLSRAADGDRLSGAEGARLLREAPLFDLGLAADAVRRRKHPHGVVTYIVDRNVNYTNVCTTSCRFCAFYRPVGHPEGYVLTREQLAEKLSEVVRAGGVQILLQGGLNPDLPLSWYEDLFRWMKREFALGLHALSPEEILHLARIEELDVRTVLERLRAAGLDSVPGGGAEILVDRVRRRIAKTKCTSEEWLGVMRVAHHMGLRSSATMMYGTTDTAEDRVQHLLKLRELQDETAGFTAFFCWDYQYEKGTRIAPGDGGTQLYLRTQAVSRLMLDNVDHVGASWVTQGPAVGQVALRFGADDFGSVMFEENVVSSAGTTFGVDAAEIERRVREAGFRVARRDVRYAWLTEPS